MTLTSEPHAEGRLVGTGLVAAEPTTAAFGLPTRCIARRVRPVERVLVLLADRAGSHSMRQFGATMVIGFGAIALLLHLTHSHFSGWVALGLGAALGIPSMIWPELMRPIRNRWMAVAEILGRINATVLLTLLYYVIVSPVGILSRLLRRDMLTRRFDANAGSYWVAKQVQEDSLRYFDQY